MLHLLLRAASGSAAGLGGWFSLGIFALGQSSNEVAPIGLLPPLWWLSLFILAGACCAVRWTRPGTGLLLLPLVGVVPWVFGAPAAVVMWNGPLLAVVWALVLLGCIPWWRIANRTTFLSTVAAGTVMAAFMWAVSPSGITGDQPHYLLIATSVLQDGDFDLANDYLENRQSPFYSGALEPWHVVLSPTGRQYSFHGPGVALLALPGFAFAGLVGAKLLLLGVSIINAAAFSAAAGLLTSSGASAWVGLAALVLQLPYIAQSSAIYPEAPAAAITSLALLTLLKLEREACVSPRHLLATGAALAFLPWLHFRFASIAVVLGSAVLWLLRRFPHALSHAMVFMAVPVISATLLFGSTYVMFETFDITAAFRQKAVGSLANAPVGVLGMLTDREYGLLVYAPALVFAAAGAPFMFRRAPVTALSGCAAATATLVVGASYVWWGGTSAPARFLVAILPILALLLAAAWTACSRFWRTVCGTMIALGAVMAGWAAVADRGAYVANAPDGRNSIFEWANPVVDLSSALPSLFREGARPADEAIVVAVWWVVGVFVFGAGLAIMRGRDRDCTTMVAWCLVIWISLAASTTWAIRGGEAVAIDRARLSLLQRSSRPWLETGFTRQDGFVTPVAALAQLEFAAPVDRDRRVLLHAPLIPAGRYRIVDDGIEASPVDRQYALELGRDAWPLHSWSRAEDAPSFATALPLHSVRVSASADLSEPRPRLRLQVIRPYAAGGLPTALRVTRYDQLLVYSLDEAMSMESGGFWLPAGRGCAVVIGGADGETTPAVAMSLEASSAVRVTLKRGALMIERALDAGRRETITLPPGAQAEVMEMLVSGERTRHAVWATVGAVAP